MHYSLSRNAAVAERQRRRIAFLGYTPNGHPVWNRPETGHIVRGYPSYADVLPKVPRRTLRAAYAKASRLKITKSRALPWSVSEIIRLRKVYPTGTREDILAAFPGRSYAAIAKAANARGIYRAPKPYKPTGNRVLDQILERARADNWSLQELDLAVHSGGYFKKRRWAGGRFNHTYHARAVAYLGGTIRMALAA